jgi:nitroimidazol reductase NimA-like FMN-containing flavoprotein (pyridoxamine 5'-phosphate oxidase superfamily)
VNYIYDNGAIYGHATWSQKVQLLRENPQVCFQVEDAERLTPWKSVIAWGHFEELRGDDAARAMRLLIYRLAQESHDEHSDLEIDLEALLDTTVMYRIRITKIKGCSEPSSL